LGDGGGRLFDILLLLLVVVLVLDEIGFDNNFIASSSEEEVTVAEFDLDDDIDDDADDEFDETIGTRGAAEKPRVTGDESSSSVFGTTIAFDDCLGSLKGTGSALPSSMPISVSMFDSTDLTMLHNELIVRLSPV
jgi:hypothetical protein